MAVLSDGKVNSESLPAEFVQAGTDDAERLSAYLHSFVGEITLMVGTNVARDQRTGTINVLEKETYTVNASEVRFETKKDLDTASEQYSAAGDWVGMLFAAQALGSVFWAMALPRFRSRKSICVPQIIAAMTGGWILAAFSVPGEIATQQLMMIVSGISLVAGAGCVCFINEGKSGC